MTLAPNFTCTSYNHRGWRIDAASLIGKGHEARGETCQDAYIVGAKGDIFWLAVADGVSTVPHGGEGAATAIAALDRHLAKAGFLDRTSMRGAFHAAHKALAEKAQSAGVDTWAFATTLVAALVTPTQVLCANLGDSNITGIAYDGNATHGLCSGRLTRETINPKTGQPERPTFGIHEADWAITTTFRAVPIETVAGIVLHTDGANSILKRSAKYGIQAMHTMAATQKPRVSTMAFATYAAAIDDQDDATIVAALRPPS